MAGHLRLCQSVFQMVRRPGRLKELLGTVGVDSESASRFESMILNGLQSTSDWDSSDVTLPIGAGVRRMAQKVLDMPRLSSDNVPPGDRLKRKAKAPEAAPNRYS